MMKKTFTTIAIALLTILALPTAGAFADQVATAAVPATDDSQTASVTFNGGALTLGGVSSINFGTHNISLTDAEYTSVAADNETPKNVTAQVTDLTGSKEGWALSLSQDNEANNWLKGANISLGAGDVALLANAGNSADANVAKTNNITPLATTTAASTLIAADKATANVGKYEITIPADSVKLAVPAAAQTEGEHTTKLVWNLTQGSLAGLE